MRLKDCEVIITGTGRGIGDDGEDQILPGYPKFK